MLLLPCLFVVVVSAVESTVRLSTSADQTRCEVIATDETSFEWKRIAMITVSKRSASGLSFKGLATINSFTNTVERFDHLEEVMANANVSGHIELDSSAGSSYLRLDHPDTGISAVGDYVCVAIGYDEFNHVIRLESNPATLTGLPLLEKVREKVVKRSEWYSNHIKKVSKVFDTSSFYFTTHGDIDFRDAVKVCSSVNGYLAEINSEQEYEFVKKFIKTSFFSEKVLTGALYRNETLEAYNHPEDTLYVGNWAKGQPKRFNYYNKQGIWLNLYAKNGKMTIDDNRDSGLGFAQRHGNKAVCEISLKYLKTTTLPKII